MAFGMVNVPGGSLTFKQDKLAGKPGQLVGFDQKGNAVAQDSPDTGVMTFHGRTGAVIPQTGDYTPAMVGLDKVDNTADKNKPVSTAQQVALDKKADRKTFNEHDSDAIRHITAEERNKWNAKQDVMAFDSEPSQGSMRLLTSGTIKAALDKKAEKSHGTHVTYSTAAPAMDGTASAGTAAACARADHRHPTDTSRAPASHNHSAGNITSGMLDAARLPVVPLEKGGLGATTPEGARLTIGAAAASHTHNTTDIKGVIPISGGGTNANNSATALANLGGFPKTGGTVTGSTTFTSRVDCNGGLYYKGTTLSLSTHTHTASQVGALSTTGGTVSGNVTLYGTLQIGTRIADAGQGYMLKFGDGDYVHFYEPDDDTLEIKATRINFLSSTITQNGSPMSRSIAVQSAVPASVQSGEIVMVYE